MLIGKRRCTCTLVHKWRNGMAKSRNGVSIIWRAGRPSGWALPRILVCVWSVAGLLWWHGHTACHVVCYWWSHTSNVHSVLLHRWSCVFIVSVEDLNRTVTKVTICMKSLWVYLLCFECTLICHWVCSGLLMQSVWYRTISLWPSHTFAMSGKKSTAFCVITSKKLKCIGVISGNQQSKVKLSVQWKSIWPYQCCYFKLQNEMLPVLLLSNTKLDKNTKPKRLLVRWCWVVSSSNISYY